MTSALQLRVADNGCMWHAKTNISVAEQYSLRIPTVQIEEIGILAPTPCHRRLGLVCPFGGYGQPMPHTVLLGAPSPTGHGGTVVACQLPQNSKKKPKSKKQPTPRPKWEKSDSTGNQLQKLARNTCGHAPARFWPPGPMLQARGAAQCPTRKKREEGGETATWGALNTHNQLPGSYTASQYRVPNWTTRHT